MTDGLSEAYETKQWDVFCENNDLLLENDQLKAENAKLRELVRDMYTVMVTDAANCDVTYPEQFDDRLRDLGIEVYA